MRSALLLFMSAILCCVQPIVTHAQATLQPETVTIEKAQVISITNQRDTTIPGTNTASHAQTVHANILEGSNAGQDVTFDNDYVQLAPGQLFYLRHTSNPLDGTNYYAVSDAYRLNVLLGLGIVFVVLVVLIGGLQGVRGFATLLGSLVLIFYALIPGILAGFSPVLVSIGVASIIIVAGSYITHGFNRTTTAAVLGMISTVLITGALAYFAVHAAHLSGFSNEEQVYLNFDTHGKIDMVGLLFGGIMIGLLGVLYDIAIGQAVAVEELFRASTLTHLQVYTRALRIGREHIGALVNTLAIAYVGAALPLLLLVQTSTYGILYAINSELFATEIIRILIGSIGLVLGVPVTTIIASYMLRGYTGKTAGVAHAHHHH